MSQESHEIYETAARVWNPNKVDLFRSFGVEMVMGKREGSRFSDLDGHTYIDMHSNGGVFNLGHRNAEVMQALIDGAQKVDAGNHYFPSKYKNDLCEALLKVSPSNMHYVYMLNGGGEANDAAIKFARRATKRTRVVALDCAFHGSTGISMEAGYAGFADFFHMSPDPEAYTHVPYNDLSALEEVLKKNDTACVILESIPATAGFPLPIEGYHKGVETLCHKYGAMYIADEVQTGLMRSGQMWCAVKYGAEPDMIVTGKGLSGGYYPMSAVIMSKEAGAWLTKDGFAHVSSFNASELGCIVSCKVMEILSRPETKKNVAKVFANVNDSAFVMVPVDVLLSTELSSELANHTEIFQWLGKPFVPLLELLRVEDAVAASSTLIVGFADMFTPSVIISGTNAAAATKFIVAVISVTQVLFLDEVGGLILASKLPINILELFIIFLERTIISLLIVCPIAHLLF